MRERSKGREALPQPLEGVEGFPQGSAGRETRVADLQGFSYAVVYVGARIRESFA